MEFWGLDNVLAGTFFVTNSLRKSSFCDSQLEKVFILRHSQLEKVLLFFDSTLEKVLILRHSQLEKVLIFRHSQLEKVLSFCHSRGAPIDLFSVYMKVFVKSRFYHDDSKPFYAVVGPCFHLISILSTSRLICHQHRCTGIIFRSTMSLVAAIYLYFNIWNMSLWQF